MGNPETKKDIDGESLLKEKVAKALDFYLDHPEKVNFLAHRDVIDSICGENPTGEITEEDQKVTFELSQAILRKIKKEPRSIDQIAEMFFSASPNLTESLSLEDSIIVSAQYSRIPELQGHIAVNMVGELVYKFTYYGGDLSGKIVEVIEKQNIPLQLDIVDFLKTIAAEAVANGSWAGQAYDVIKNTLVKLKDGSKYPIVQIAVEISLKRILKEADEPTLFFIKYRGDKTNSRLREERVKSSEIFMFPHDDKVGVIDKRLHPVRIAKDAIAYVDHSNTPVGIARREQKVISLKEYEAGFLQRILEVVREDEVRDVFDLVLNYASMYKDLRNRADVAQEIADVLGADQQTILGLINTGHYFDRELSEIEAQKASAEISDLLQSLPR